MTAPERRPGEAPVNAHTLANAVKIRGAIYYQNPNGGRPQLLVSAEELDARRMTQDRWLVEQRDQLRADSERNGSQAPVDEEEWDG